MKILEITSELDGGGVDRLLYDYCSRMTPNIYFDFIVTSDIKGILEEPLEKLGCTVYHLPPFRKQPLVHIRRLKQLYTTYNYDMKLFRYPYGYFSEMLLKFLSLQGFTQMFWSYGYRDWVTNDQPDEGSSKRNIIKAACPGMIYLLHTESKTNANILGDCIDGIRAAGFMVGDCSDFLKFY